MLNKIEREAAVSEEVCTLMRTACAAAAPIVNPLIVTVKAEPLIIAPNVVITTDVAVVAPQVNVSSITLLAPGETLGVTEDAKKSDV